MTAYHLRISDWSSDVCSSDLLAAEISRTPASFVHPAHAVLLAGGLPLFLGGLLSDIGYAASYQIQWTNFASWLIAGALVFSGFALLWALVDLIRARRRTGRVLISFMLLLETWVLGFINALFHANDA